MKPILGSNVRRNNLSQNTIGALSPLAAAHGIPADMMTQEERQLLEKAFEEQKESKAKKSFLVYTDNQIGPGHYEPNKGYLMRNQPSARVPQQEDGTVHKGGPNHVRNNVEGFAEIVSGEGNLAARVNAAQGIIKTYLGVKKLLDKNTIEP